MDLKLKLKNLRIKYNYSQENIAEVLDISVRQYQRIENGDNKPSLDVLMNLSKIYNRNLINDYLLSNDNSYLYIKELELELKDIIFNIDKLKIFINKIQ
ncbi:MULTISPECIES: helix-turn-helix domain-containing protein [Helcococcus]|uniref:Helix-turn-helix transcriptional regulator n=1 Tax=Helcococcus bovis TaxID=3153252 RepID=A0ABW9F622_9FIRM